VDEPFRTVRETARALIAPLVVGRPVFLVGNATGSKKMADFFAHAGAAAVHDISLPDPEGPLAWRYATLEQLLATPPDIVARQADSLDPQGSGVAYAGSFTAVSSFCGRPVLGSRSSRAFAAERKDVQNQLLGHPSRRVLVELSDLAQAHDAITTFTAGRPAALQGIPRELLAMGTSHTYGIPSRAPAETLDHVLTTMAGDCTAVSLAPLDRGISCTYYGFVADDWVVDFGPVEALVYWDRRTWRLHAPGVVRPLPLDDRTAGTCRAAVHRVARELHRHTDYTGAFGTDGVVNGVGYSIHEINPRICAGFALLDQLSPQPVPLAAVDLALRQDPGAASRNVVGSLRALAAELQAAQRPMIRLWDPEHHRSQDHLLMEATTTTDAQTWLRLARERLSSADLIPIADFDSAGAEPCA
jgi:hypothetical protein